MTFTVSLSLIRALPTTVNPQLFASNPLSIITIMAPNPSSRLMKPISKSVVLKLTSGSLWMLQNVPSLDTGSLIIAVLVPVSLR